METEFSYGYALLIGVTESRVARYALPDAAKDIAAVSEVLAHPERCGYPAANVRVVTGPAATRSGILEGLDWLAERAAADSSGNATALIYYSGHGWRDKSQAPPGHYLLPYDVRSAALAASSLRAEEFAGAIRGIAPRRLLVVLDCCHAAGMGVKEAGADFASAAIPPALLMDSKKEGATGAKGLEALAQGAGRAVLSSSQGHQPSYMRRDGRMSIFTYHLIEALTGHAQPAAGATDVLVSDVMSHVWRRTPASARADWGADQQPDYQVSGNFPIALLLGGQGMSKGVPPPDPLAPLPAVGLVATGGSAINIGSGVAFVGDGNTVITGKVGGDVVRGR